MIVDVIFIYLEQSEQWGLIIGSNTNPFSQHASNWNSFSLLAPTLNYVVEKAKTHIERHGYTIDKVIFKNGQLPVKKYSYYWEDNDAETPEDFFVASDLSDETIAIGKLFAS
jgi:hypothetical protein